MRILILLTLNILLPFISANETVGSKYGDIKMHASVGNLPLKYIPMTEEDVEASLTASDILGFIALAPNIDPFKLDAPPPVGIDIPHLWLNGVAYMKNFQVSGITSLIIEGVQLRLINLRADLNITIPQIYFESDFNLQATMSFLPVRLRCSLSGTLYDMRIMVSAGAKQDNIPPTGKVLQIDSAEVDINIKDAKFNFTSISIGGAKETVGTPVTQLFKKTRRVKGRKGSLYDNILKTAMILVNQQLAEISADAFLPKM
ncbi:uncharacterized protein LOC110384213 isoform X1 [Helicoverpa armigera]|uniref:uncharacterized protein LOC110384213 isoform X1 n=2 Tax=Helicoverpa armigera TaxID=29058 RepID=UPI003082778C